jgi:hypothetical protein
MSDSSTTDKKFASFAEFYLFYLFYLSEHCDHTSRRLHFAGTNIALVLFITASPVIGACGRIF